MVLLFVEWDDGSGVGMMLKMAVKREFCETRDEYRFGCLYLYSVFGDRIFSL